MSSVAAHLARFTEHDQSIVAGPTACPPPWESCRDGDIIWAMKVHNFPSPTPSL